MISLLTQVALFSPIEPTVSVKNVGSIGENSATWVNNDIMYYATSDALDTNELLKVAESISNNAIEK